MTTRTAITRATRGVNQQLVDRAVRHAVFFERLKSGEVNRIVSMLHRDVVPDLVKQVEARLPAVTRGAGAATTRRLRELTAANNALISGGVRSMSRAHRERLANLAVSESAWQRAMLKGATAGLNLDFVTPSVRALQSIISSKPMEGHLLSTWWNKLSTRTASEVQRQINMGLAQGEAVPKIVRRLVGTRAARYADGVIAETRRNVTATVRTAMTHVSAHAREATYAANSTVIKSVQYVATLDARTTDICASLDGRVFPINEGERPPMHHQCRSTTVPVLKSWKELGIDLKEAPRGTRASMNGQVPERTTYGSWLRRQPRRVQEEVLGKGRAQLFRERKVPIEKFVDYRHRPISLREMRRAEGGPQARAELLETVSGEKYGLPRTWTVEERVSSGGRHYKLFNDDKGNTYRSLKQAKAAARRK